MLSALGAYLLWGVLPIFFKQLQHVPPLEILSHRIVWSFILLFLGFLSYFSLVKPVFCSYLYFFTCYLIVND